MGRATITAAPNQNNTHPANMPSDPFTAGGGGKGNLFPGTDANPRAPATEAQKAALCVHIAAFPMQPNTSAGLEAYRDQCRAWLAAFGANQKITELTGFPLLPGGTPLGSGECYICGKRVTHSRTARMSRYCSRKGNGGVFVAPFSGMAGLC
jgi:hypothetical protein